MSDKPPDSLFGIDIIDVLCILLGLLAWLLPDIHNLLKVVITVLLVIIVITIRRVPLSTSLLALQHLLFLSLTAIFGFIVFLSIFWFLAYDYGDFHFYLYRVIWLGIIHGFVFGTSIIAYHFLYNAINIKYTNSTIILIHRNTIFVGFITAITIFFGTVIARFMIFNDLIREPIYYGGAEMGYEVPGLFMFWSIPLIPYLESSYLVAYITGNWIIGLAWIIVILTPIIETVMFTWIYRKVTRFKPTKIYTKRHRLRGRKSD